MSPSIHDYASDHLVGLTGFLLAPLLAPLLALLLALLLAPLTAPALSAQTVDLKWGRLGNPVVVGRVGSFPAGMNGLTLSTTLCNEGTGPAPFRAAMDEAHPGTVLALYQIATDPDGVERMQQIGASWVFHDFLPVGQSFCGTCTGSSPDALWAGCSNTHSSFIVADRFWLGPRSEWNAHLGSWTCLGSYFDGVPVDCVRDETGAGLDVVAHRLAVADADLGLPGAQYLLEALVLQTGEADRSDNVASQRVTMFWTGNNWNFNTPLIDNALVDGPAVLRWGDLQTVAGLAPHDGEVALSASVTALGGGRWRYEYALFNASLDRLVDGLSLTAGDVAFDAAFHDPDADPSTDWDVTLVAGTLSWALPASVGVEAGPLGGPLEFGVLYGFGFTSNRPPITGPVRLGIHLAGAGGDQLVLSTLVPDVSPDLWVVPGNRAAGASPSGAGSGAAPTPSVLPPSHVLDP